MANLKKHAALNLGVSGEDAVQQWYEQAGFEILARNWKCFEGEIDLIVRRGRLVVFCEVKTRSTRFMDAALSITPAKQSKVRTAAHRWLAQNTVRARIRFDVALVTNGSVNVMVGAF